MEKTYFGRLSDGTPVGLFRIGNKNGMEAEITEFGATLVSLKTKDKNGKYEDIVHGFPDVSGYESKKNPYFGGTIGRFAGDIPEGKAVVRGTQYRLSLNFPGIHRHGGTGGFSHQLWKVSEKTENALEMKYHSADGDDGYPGNLDISVRYEIDEEDSLCITYHALSDQDTILNLTNHSYFNLEGDHSDSISDHCFILNADGFYHGDDIRSVENTVLDLRRETRIGDVLKKSDPLIQNVGGVDYYYTFPGHGYRKIAEVYAPKSRRCMEVLTDNPCMILYTGNFLNGSLTGKDQVCYARHSAFCMETSRHPIFQSEKDYAISVMDKGEPVITKTCYRFYVKE